MANPNEAPTIPGARVILEAGQALGRPQQLGGHRPYAIVPAGAAMQEIPRELPPDMFFITQRPSFRDVKSFIAYVIRFKDARTQLFADERAGRIVAVLDYHQPDGPENVKVQRCSHVATFTAEASPEWTEWAALDGKQQRQEEFATFIEDQAPFIVRPDAATMLEIASSLQASSSANFSKAIRLDNGQVQFQYVENINGNAGPKGQLEVPKTFDVLLRPFIGCSAYKVEARFRYRLESGRMPVWYDLFRVEDIQREAFDAIIKNVADDVAIVPYIGQH